MRKVLLLTALLGSLSVSAAEGAVVLMYHHFGVDKYPSTNIRLEQFEAQLDYLERNDYKVWPLSAIALYLQQEKALPEKVVALTMDDAYESVYTEAYPRLKKRDWPFTVFVNTDYIDGDYANYLSWEQMREMEKHGAEFSNHAAQHSHLVLPGPEDPQWEEQVRENIQSAQDRLQEMLGDHTNHHPPMLAYPYGEYSEPLANIVADMGFVAFGQHSGAIGLNSDRRALPRYPMAEKFADMEQFAQKLNTVAMPIASVTPWDPLTPSRKPELTVTLREKLPNGQLRCFISGVGKGEPQWLDGGELKFKIVSSEALAIGRNRYNCTAPTGQGGRFYWYSHPWIVLPPGEKLPD